MRLSVVATVISDNFNGSFRFNKTRTDFWIPLKVPV